MSVPDFLVGVDLTAMTISGLTKAGNGLLTIGATADITGYFLEVDPSIEFDLEDVRPTNQRQRNMVPTGQGAPLRIAVLQRSSAFNAITTLMQTYLYFEVDWTQGAEPFSYRGVVQRWNGGIKQRGGNPLILELAPISENGAFNLARTG